MCIIKILENIILYNNNNITEDFLKNHNIKKILIIDTDKDLIYIDDKYINQYKISLISNSQDINFDYTNNQIINLITNLTDNILIISQNNILGFIIISGFIMKYLKISILECFILGIKNNINKF
jgi:hypothetical protein